MDKVEALVMTCRNYAAWSAHVRSLIEQARAIKCLEALESGQSLLLFGTRQAQAMVKHPDLMFDKQAVNLMKRERLRRQGKFLLVLECALMGRPNGSH